MAQWVINLPVMQGTQETRPRVEKIPWKRAWQPIPACFPGESMDRGAWWVIVHRVTNS